MPHKFFSWCIHLLTSLGVICGFMAIVAIQADRWSETFLWLAGSLLIDSIDGTLARHFQVHKYLPMISGKQIDFVVDFICYAFIPSYFFYSAEMASPEWLIPCVFLMLISSTLYYGKKQMTRGKEHFVGFPVLWNMVVFYQFFVFGNIKFLNLISVIILAILHFVPIKFPYPSKSKRFLVLHITVSVIGLVSAVYLLLIYPADLAVCKYVLILIAIYFFGFVIRDTLETES